MPIGEHPSEKDIKSRRWQKYLVNWSPSFSSLAASYGYNWTIRTQMNKPLIIMVAFATVVIIANHRNKPKF